MEHEVVSKSDFKLVGITKRISNENAQQEIPNMWKDFIVNNYLDKIPSKVNSNLMALYSNYEGDHTKPFDYSIGVEVSSANEVPPELNTIVVKANKYALFKVKGELPESLIETWKFIWNSDLKRKFDADFEVVIDADEVHIYLSIE